MTYPRRSVGGVERRRRRMVRRDIARRGVADRRVLDAMALVPRERFVSDDVSEAAFDDRALPIGDGQTISQPYIVALMAASAEVHAGDRVLEVGTGSGYGAAVLSRLAAEVWTVERHPSLARRAQEVLDALRAEHVLESDVHVVIGDGTMGHPDAAPYDAIVVTAAGPSVPPALLAQLDDGGRLVMPVGTLGSGGQELVRVRRRGEQYLEDELGGVRFVPLIGEQGFGPTGGPG